MDAAVTPPGFDDSPGSLVPGFHPALPAVAPLGLVAISCPLTTVHDPLVKGVSYSLDIRLFLPLFV